jgi:MFS family permease
MLVTLVPLYQSECSPPKIRGLLVGTHGILLCCGYSAASWVGVGFFFVHASGAQWRLPLAIQCVAPLVLSIAVFFLPESPRWRKSSGRSEHNSPRTLITTQLYVKTISRKHSLPSRPAGLTRTKIPRRCARTSAFCVLKFDMRRKVTYPCWTCSGGQICEDAVCWDSIPCSSLKAQPPWLSRVSLTSLCLHHNLIMPTLDYASIIYSSLGFSPINQLLIQSGYITVCPFGNAINALVVDKVGRTRMLSKSSASVILGGRLGLIQFQ